MIFRISKGEMNIDVDKKFLASIAELSDGIRVNFKDGMFLEMTDAYMPMNTKRVIKMMYDKIPNGAKLVTLRLDPRFYNSPLSIEY